MAEPAAVAAGDQLMAEIAEQAAKLVRDNHPDRLTATDAALVDVGINAGASATFLILRKHRISLRKGTLMLEGPSIVSVQVYPPGADLSHLPEPTPLEPDPDAPLPSVDCSVCGEPISMDVMAYGFGCCESVAHDACYDGTGHVCA